MAFPQEPSSAAKKTSSGCRGAAGGGCAADAGAAATHSAAGHLRQRATHDYLQQCDTFAGAAARCRRRPERRSIFRPGPATSESSPTLGPGKPQGCLASLLNGSKFNYVILGERQQSRSGAEGHSHGEEHQPRPARRPHTVAQNNYRAPPAPAGCRAARRRIPAERTRGREPEPGSADCRASPACPVLQNLNA